MGPLSRTRSNLRVSKGKLYLYCQHPVAQERFLHLLKRSEFQIAIMSELLPPAGAPDVNGLAVIDGSHGKVILEFARRLHFESPGLHLLVLLPELQDAATYPLLRVGVKGLLSYQLAPRELCRAARQVAAGGYWVPRDLLTRFVDSILPELSGCKSLDSEAEISRREREVLDLLLDNLSNKEIASKLFVTERTVKFHVSNLLSKFHVQRRADLIVLWMQRNSSFPWTTRSAETTVSARVN
jgi:DNA-binding NarL/FixJ family response regulator